MGYLTIEILILVTYSSGQAKGVSTGMYGPVGLADFAIPTQCLELSSRDWAAMYMTKDPSACPCQPIEPPKEKRGDRTSCTTSGAQIPPPLQLGTSGNASSPVISQVTKSFEIATGTFCLPLVVAKA